MLRRILAGLVLAWLMLGVTAWAQDVPDAEAETLRVVETLPTDGAIDVPTAGVITVVFNRPVVPLTAVEGQDALPDPLRFSPDVAGSGEWLNSAIYTFTPDPALAANTTYTVTLDTLLTAVDGVQAEPFTFSFTTVAAQVTGVNPEPGAAGVRPDASLQITFNMPMGRESVERALILSTEQNSAPVTGTFEWTDDSTGLRFTPAALLDFNTQYFYRLGTGATGEGGGPGIQPLEGAFTTVSLPGIVSTSPFDGQTDSQLYGVTIYFASPMNPDTFDDRISIEPEPARTPDLYYSDYDNSLTISYPMEPSTDYTVTLAPGAEDIFGNAIAQPFSFSFTTVPFDPSIRLEVPQGVGFYNADAPQTQVYLTHLNVSQVDLSLYRVPVEDALPSFVGDNSYDPASFYVPNASLLLRSWSIPSQAPQNALRYELLDLSASGAFDCPGAPPARVQIGDSARVISDPDPVRARATPGDGEIVTLLYRDYAFTVTGGPECMDGLLWWQVSLRDGGEGWVAEGVEGEYFIEPTGRPVATPVTLAAEGGALPPGIYYLEATAPELEATNRGPVRHFMIVGSANLTFKTSIDSALVWATDVQSGTPIANAPISVYDGSYQLIGQGVTDADGLVRIELPRAEDLYRPRMAVLDDGQHFGVTTNNWSQGIDSYVFNLPLDSAPEAFRAYVYTDRPIYRPGQPVYFRGVVRSRDDVQYGLTPLTQVPVRIYGGDDGALLYEDTLALTPYGTFNGQFTLAGDAPLGYYRVVAELPRANPDQPYYGIEGTIGFTVAQYRLPEFQVTTTPERNAVIQQETVRVLVDSRYFFGGVVSNAAVTYNVVAQPYFFSADGASDYSFVDFNYDTGSSENFGVGGGVVASGEGTTDAQGRFLVEVPADLRDATQSLTFTVEATVTDESGQAVSGRADVIVHKSALYVGVRPQEYVGVAGQETGVDIIATDIDSARLSGTEVDVEVVERRWSSVQQEDASGRTTWSWEVEDIPVTSGTVTTDADGQASFRFTPPTGGVYKIIVRARDAQGNESVASTNLWVSSDEFVSWRQQNSNRIDLIADRTEYAVGDSAEILIASPFQGSAEALVTVERGDILYSERVTLTGNSTVYRLPILADYAPNVYVSVFIVKGVDETNPVAGFRMGMVQLSVDTSGRQIALEVTPDRDQAGPGDTVTYTVRATDAEGAPVQAEVGLALTDLASLSLAPSNSLPILDYFYGQQSLSVRTAALLTLNVDQLTQEVLNTIKGGGGGFGEGGIFDIREDFVDTAYWNGSLVTDASGEARFSVTLPDNLTTWRLDARAVTRGEDGNTRVGQTTVDLLSTKPLLIRPVTPRFFVVGDEAVVAAIVNNNSQGELAVDVRLDVGGGASAASDLTQRVNVPAGGRQRVEWTLSISDADALALRFFADAPEASLQDASAPPLGQGPDRTLPIYRYDAPETVATAGVVEAGQQVTETIDIPAQLGATEAEARVSIQSSLVAAALRDLDAVELSPNPSAEEVVSSFLPNLMLSRVLRAAGIQDPALDTTARESLVRGLQILVAAQRVDGGWGWYRQDESDPTVTAYVLIGLSEARADGYTIDDGLIERAQAYLRSQLITPSLSVETWRLNRQSLLLYALALSGRPDDARMATLYESRQSMSLYAQALLAQALALSSPADPRASALLDALAATAITSATGTHWEESERDPYNWNTDTRTTAIVLNVLLQQRPESTLIPNIVRWLMTARTADAWATTQETSWSLMALARYIAVTGDVGLSAQDAADATTVTIGGDVVPLQVAGDEAVANAPAPTDAPSSVEVANGGASSIYYTAQLDLSLPMANVGPLNEGIIVERRYTVGEGQDQRVVTSAAVGDLVTVRLTLIAPNDLYYVVVEDPTPAGAEAIDPNLSTSQQVGTRPQLDATDPLSQGWGWWWFSSIQFRDEKVVLSARYLPAGSYEFVYTLRPGLPGTYNVLPATAREAYFPEVFGRSAGAVFTIAEG